MDTNGLRKYFRYSVWFTLGSLLILLSLPILPIPGAWGSFSSLVWARPPGGRPPGPPPQRGVPFEHLIEELGLDDETLAQADAIIDASRTEEQSLRRKLREADRSMRALLEQEEPDEDAVMTQVGSIGGLRTALRKEQLRTMLRVRALLTPEQRVKLLERLKERPRRGPGRRGRHGGPPPGRFGGPGDDSSRQPPPHDKPF